ncbi:hypothetical protein K432DRAFT_439497 [Lepidopterella palustris CBS 459.81]|uniref:Uncharacterized protein n=1 Tax=Lepidopterella palustris CBS 459.81 TaxID=1314670 RepID=A0A8E2EJY4_9PEZI|nr:hypothetical protein K432DRAFT_439497 [Lepidopterella palustris CBS 459.81]
MPLKPRARNQRPKGGTGEAAQMEKEEKSVMKRPKPQAGAKGKTVAKPPTSLDNLGTIEPIEKRRERQEENLKVEERKNGARLSHGGPSLEELLEYLLLLGTSITARSIFLMKERQQSVWWLFFDVACIFGEVEMNIR